MFQLFINPDIQTSTQYFLFLNLKSVYISLLELVFNVNRSPPVDTQLDQCICN